MKMQAIPAVVEIITAAEVQVQEVQRALQVMKLRAEAAVTLIPAAAVPTTLQAAEVHHRALLRVETGHHLLLHQEVADDKEKCFSMCLD